MSKSIKKEKINKNIITEEMIEASKNNNEKIYAPKKGIYKYEDAEELLFDTNLWRMKAYIYFKKN